jgi:hypothetical protein
MDEFIGVSVFHPDYVLETRFNFAHKAKICLAMSLNQQHDRIWDLLWQANSLRNAIAHGDSADEIKRIMGAVRRLYLSILTPEQAKGVEKEPDDSIAQSTFLLCAGFLAALQDEAKSRRKIIDDPLSTHNFVG